MNSERAGRWAIVVARLVGDSLPNYSLDRPYRPYQPHSFYCS